MKLSSVDQIQIDKSGDGKGVKRGEAAFRFHLTHNIKNLNSRPVNCYYLFVKL